MENYSYSKQSTLRCDTDVDVGNRDCGPLHQTLQWKRGLMEESQLKPKEKPILKTLAQASSLPTCSLASWVSNM